METEESNTSASLPRPVGRPVLGLLRLQAQARQRIGRQQYSQAATLIDQINDGSTHATVEWASRRAANHTRWPCLPAVQPGACGVIAVRAVRHLLTVAWAAAPLQLPSAPGPKASGNDRTTQRQGRTAGDHAGRAGEHIGPHGGLVADGDLGALVTTAVGVYARGSARVLPSPYRRPGPRRSPTDRESCP
jgi:hypothetical protein